MKICQRSLAELWPRMIAPAMILAAITMIYGQMLGHGFVNFDDPVYITDNPHVLRGLTGEGVRWAFSTGLTGMWHPLTWLSLMANVTWFGVEPGGFHAVNVALHFGSAVLLYASLLTATGLAGRSLLAALLFAVHPLNVESIAWASQRKSTLSTFFCMIAILAWVRHVRSGRRAAYWIALVAFGLGLLAKPMLVSLPFILILLEIWPLAGRQIGWRRRLGELLPFFALSAIFAWICLHPFGPTDVAQGASRIVAADIFNTPLNIVTYFGRLARPVDLAVLYPHRSDWSGMACALSTGGLFAVVILAWKWGRPVWLMGLGWFLIALLPVSGIIAVGPHATADRYVYLPAVGLFIAVAWTMPWQPLWFVLGGVVVTVWGALAFAQVGLWRSSAVLWQHAAAVTSDSPTLWLNLGAGLVEVRRDADAEIALRRALDLTPGEHRAWLNLAYIYDRNGNKPAALEALREAMRRVPGDARIHNHLGSLLCDLGQWNEGEAELREAIKLRPEYAEPWVNLGVLFVRRGDYDDAVRSFERALQIQPYVVGARSNLEKARAELAARTK